MRVPTQLTSRSINRDGAGASEVFFLRWGGRRSEKSFLIYELISRGTGASRGHKRKPAVVTHPGCVVPGTVALSYCVIF